MASWHNNFPYPPNWGPNPEALSPPQTSSIPYLSNKPKPDTTLSGPFLPPPLHLNYPPPSVTMSQPFLPGVPPPICNTALPPPPITSLPPPILHGVPAVPLSQIREPIDEEEKFEKFKLHLEGRYQSMKQVKNPCCQLKVSEIKEKLVNCYSRLEQLESLSNCLQLTYRSLPEEEWLNYCKDAGNVKEELSSLLNELRDTHFLREMKKAVQKRKKKRGYRKRKQKEWQEQKRVAKLHGEQENRRIDLWLEKMKDQVARAKREEDIKREADFVLSDVTAKKAEAKRMLNMLNSLAKLRAARAQNLSNEKSVSEIENKAFNEIIDRLKKMWLEKFNGYKVEEEGLKVMLEHAEEERASLEAAQLRKNLKAWTLGIFGVSTATQPFTAEELIKTRQDWDKFICADDAPMASSIPVGWVLPCEPSSEEWAKLL